MINSFRLFAVLMLISYCLQGQQRMSREQYIDKYKDIAIEEMHRKGVPASIKLAQGILESGFGNSDLAVQANNHFGIKCHGWQGRTFHKDDDAKNECFRAYDDPIQSFIDHSEFLTSRPRYAGLFELEITDYKGWAQGLRQAGYATNPNYPQLLIRVIEENQLHRFDKMTRGALVRQTSSERTSRRTNAADQDEVVMPGEEFARVGIGRRTGENNRIRYVIAQEGDTPEKLAQELNMWPWQIYRYNDLSRDARLQAGQMIYLQPKRRRGAEAYHHVKPGETMYAISQKHGIRLQQLYRRNAMEPGTEATPGQRLLLRGRVKP